MSLRKLASLTTLSLVGVLLAGFGCSTGSSVTGTATLRTVNALPGVNTSAVNFDQTNTSTVLTTNISYGTSSAYQTVNAGLGITEYAIAGGNLITSAAYNITPNTTNTLIAFGDYQNATTSSLAPVMVQYQDNIPTTASLGTTLAAIRVIHVAPISIVADQTVDLYNNGTAMTGQTGVTYGNATSYTTVTAGTFNFSLHSHSTGSVILLPSATVTSLSSFNLGVGHAYTILFVGTDDTGGTNPASTDPPDVKVLVDE